VPSAVDVVDERDLHVVAGGLVVGGLEVERDRRTGACCRARRRSRRRAGRPASRSTSNSCRSVAPIVLRRLPAAFAANVDAASSASMSAAARTRFGIDPVTLTWSSPYSIRSGKFDGGAATATGPGSSGFAIAKRSRRRRRRSRATRGTGRRAGSAAPPTSYRRAPTPSRREPLQHEAEQVAVRIAVGVQRQRETRTRCPAASRPRRRSSGSSARLRVDAGRFVQHPLRSRRSGRCSLMTSPPTVAAWLPQPVNDVAVLPV
jgi:hypothetical protein